MKPLRILLVSDFPYMGNVRGGVESAAQILASALSDSELVEAVCVVNFRMDRWKDEIVRLNDKLVVHYLAGQRHLALPTRSIVDMRKAKRIAKVFRPDIVHGQGTDTHGDVATRLGYPSAITIHGVGSFEAELREKGNPVVGPLRVRLTKQLINRVIRNAGVVISISAFDREFCSGKREGPIATIPNAIRSEFFDVPPPLTDSKRILFSGLIIERKNVAGIVRAFRLVKQGVPDAILDIAGPAPDTKYYEEVMRSVDPALRNDIVFHGSLTASELSGLMSRAALAVLFSVYENLPVAIAEAFAAGRPVVASRVGSVGEMVENGVSGFLVESEDEREFANRVVMLLNDPQLRMNMGVHARDVALKKWNARNVAGKTVRAYRLVLSGRHGDAEPVVEQIPAGVET
ncbi:MAG: glycosyltransferase family 4 protein [Bacteroidetes bacterium]|nr:glycosyltransferase family 4 protein [Bacteroidota bacterium]MCW5895375.1 glycosyltransferase family 4 protein [Bacteroidota bacterium]